MIHRETTYHRVESTPELEQHINTGDVAYEFAHVGDKVALKVFTVTHVTLPTDDCLGSAEYSVETTIVEPNSDRTFTTKVRTWYFGGPRSVLDWLNYLIAYPTMEIAHAEFARVSNNSIVELRNSVRIIEDKLNDAFNLYTQSVDSEEGTK